MKIISLAVCIALASVACVEATTVGISSSPSGSSLYSPGGGTLPDGDLVRVGMFTNPNAINLGLSVAQIETMGGWTEFGSIFTKSILGNAGKLSDTITENSALATPFNGKNLYLWSFNASTATNATAMGIFRSNSGTPAWVFPTNNNGFSDTVSLSLNESTLQAINGVGSVNQGQSKLQLSSFVGVPEVSSTGLLYGLAAVLFFGTQRPRRRPIAPSR